jgi:hypothetical protein
MYNYSMKFLWIVGVALAACTGKTPDGSAFHIGNSTLHIHLPSGWTGHDNTFGAGVLLRGADMPEGHTTLVLERETETQVRSVKERYLADRLRNLEDTGAAHLSSEEFQALPGAKVATEVAGFSYQTNDKNYVERIYVIDCKKFLLRAQALVPGAGKDVQLSDDIVKTVSCD